MTKNRRSNWQRKCKLLGDCIICGKPRPFHDKFFCDYHRLRYWLNLNVRLITSKLKHPHV